MSMKSILLVAAILAAGVGAAEARAVPVSRAGVDFLDAGAVDAFHRDLARAAEEACDTYSRPTLLEMQLKRACRAEAVTRAVVRTNIPTLTVLHEGLSAGQRINASRAPIDDRVLAAVAAAADSMRAEVSTTVVASLR